MPRPRFTLRWLMAAVAVAVVMLWIAERHIRFRRLADYHASIVMDRFGYVSLPTYDQEPQADTDVWHQYLAAKYEHAARYPWLPVAPDPE